MVEIKGSQSLQNVVTTMERDGLKEYYSAPTGGANIGGVQFSVPSTSYENMPSALSGISSPFDRTRGGMAVKLPLDNMGVPLSLSAGAVSQSFVDTKNSAFVAADYQPLKTKLGDVDVTAGVVGGATIRDSVAEPVVSAYAKFKYATKLKFTEAVVGQVSFSPPVTPNGGSTPTAIASFGFEF